MEQKIKLRNLAEEIKFSASMNGRSNEVKITYENGEEEYISTPYFFLQDLDIFYRNRIEHSDDTNYKIFLCNEFILELQKYKSSFAHIVNDQERFESEISLHREYFEILKQNLSENRKVSVSNDKGYSAKQQVLILEYLGVIGNLRSNELTEKAIGEVVAIITGKDATNIVRAIRNSSRAVETSSDETKTRANLEAVKEFFTKYQLPEIADKIQQELNTLKKG